MYASHHLEDSGLVPGGGEESGGESVYLMLNLDGSLPFPGFLCICFFLLIFSLENGVQADCLQDSPYHVLHNVQAILKHSAKW